MITVFLDADACPVKDEAYKVAARYGLKTLVVSNSFMQIPQSPLIERVIVDAGPDIADDWIAERAAPGDVVVTNDIPLAERVLSSGASAIAPNGKPFTRDSIGSAIAQRALMEQLRSTGDILGGPKPFDRNDRSRFLQALDEAIQREIKAPEMIEIAPNVRLDENELEFAFIRASGPGGQNVNKVSSAVQMRFDARRSPSLSNDVSVRLQGLAGSKLTSEGVIVITANRHRTQEMNRKDAIDRLVEMIERAAIAPIKRRATKPTKASKEKRLESKARRSGVKSMRSRPTPGD